MVFGNVCFCWGQMTIPDVIDWGTGWGQYVKPHFPPFLTVPGYCRLNGLDTCYYSIMLPLLHATTATCYMNTGKHKHDYLQLPTYNCYDCYYHYYYE